MNKPFQTICALILAVVESVSADDVSLKAAYADCFVIGTAIPGANLSEAERQLLLSQFNAVTPEDSMKPAPIHPEENRFDFAATDALVEMARDAGLTVNAHTLIWHQRVPNWFFRDGERAAGKDLVLSRMRDHIARVAGHYAGKVESWDVVNEAIDDGIGYLRNTPWLSSIGEDYIAEAFIAARRADPDAELYYNDYGIEEPAKRKKALRLLRNLKRRGLPIDGIGIQGHWVLDKIPFKDIENAIIAFAVEDVKVMITELDIDVLPRESTPAMVVNRHKDDDPFANGLPYEVQRRLADQYAQLFDLFRKHRDKISRVSFWGLYDGRSWLNYWPSERTNHPLLWDRALQPKPALPAVLELARKGYPCN